MTIAITSSGIALDGPLVAGEKVAVAVSGLALSAEDKPTLALLARFPDALLASVELAEDADAPGTWTGELDTATKQTALFFATARADERRDAALELVAGRASLARITVPMANSALCPKPDGSPFASPVYVPVPGPPGQGGDPYDQAPEMDGEASAGVSDEYARGDHRHPTDTSRASAADVTAIQNIIPSTATPTNKLTTASDLSGKANDADVVKLTGKQTVAGDKTFTGQVSAADIVTGYSFGFQDGKYITAPANSGASLTAGDISDSSSALGAALAAKADSSSLATVATTGDYDDLTNKPTIPAAQVNADWNASSGVAQILNKPTIPDVSGKADAASIAPAFSASSTYAVGDYCTHEGLLYKCTTAVSTAGAWNAANWSAVAVTDEMGGSQEQADWNQSDSTAPDFIKNKPTIPAAITVDSAMSSSSTNPVQNKVVDAAIKERVPWSADSSNNQTAVSVGTRKQPPTGGVWQDTGENSVTIGPCRGIGQRSLSQGFETIGGGNNSCAQGNATVSYGVNSHAEGRETCSAGYASHTEGYRSVCAAQGSGTSPVTPHDYAFAWQGVTDGNYYHSHGTGTFNVNPVGGTAGFYIGEDSLASLFRYSFASPTPSVSGTSATVACEDRSINDFTVTTGITSLTITPPAAVTNRARDFFCRVTLTDSSLPTVTLSGGTIDIGSTEVAGMTQGVNLLMFTEISGGHWLASRRSAS